MRIKKKSHASFITESTRLLALYLSNKDMDLFTNSTLNKKWNQDRYYTNSYDISKQMKAKTQYLLLKPTDKRFSPSFRDLKSLSN